MNNAPNEILNLERAAAGFLHVSQFAALLAADLSPMPDGHGTVADRFKTAIESMEKPANAILQALDGQADAIQNNAIAQEAAEPPVMAIRAPAPPPASLPQSVPENAPAPAVARPGTGPRGIIPAGRRRMAGS